MFSNPQLREFKEGDKADVSWSNPEQTIFYLRGQEIKLQAFDSMAEPRPMAAQSWPPLAGDGLEQDRYLCISPPPHVTSHSDQSLHRV